MEYWSVISMYNFITDSALCLHPKSEFSPQVFHSSWLSLNSCLWIQYNFYKRSCQRISGFSICFLVVKCFQAWSFRIKAVPKIFTLQDLSSKQLLILSRAVGLVRSKNLRQMGWAHPKHQIHAIIASPNLRKWGSTFPNLALTCLESSR